MSNSPPWWVIMLAFFLLSGGGGTVYRLVRLWLSGGTYSPRCPTCRKPGMFD